jgi:hypothetical protein
MRKRILPPAANDLSPREQTWLDVDQLAHVEVTSEEVIHPIEAALLPGTGSGWRAAQPGEQTIRLVFDAPLKLRRIHLVCQEEEVARTQEFVLRWSPDQGQSYREVVRQQFTFSPPGTTREVEDYSVELDGVTALELRIVPDISGGGAVASLAQWRLTASL